MAYREIVTISSNQSSTRGDPRDPLHALRSTLCDPRFALHALRSTLCDPRFALHAVRSMRYAPRATLHALRSTRCAPRTALHMLRPTRRAPRNRCLESIFQPPRIREIRLSADSGPTLYAILTHLAKFHFRVLWFIWSPKIDSTIDFRPAYNLI